VANERFVSAAQQLWARACTWQVNLAQVLFGSVLLTVKDEDRGRVNELFSTTDNELGQANVRLDALQKEPSHTYTVPLDKGPIDGKGQLVFSATWSDLPPDEAAMRVAYEASGRTVPVSTC
jgi:hypothetical protein